MTPFLKQEREGAVLVLTMDQPATRNALNGTTIVDEFVQALDAANRDPGVHAIVLAAEGPVFCAGGNLKDMLRYADAAVDAQQIEQDYLQGIQRLPLAFHALEVPVVAAVQGPAIGVGLDLACMCDIRIAGEAATFAESFIKVGLVPGDGGAWLLPRVVGQSKASEMAFTGEALDAQQALACGLVSRVVPAAQLREAALDLAGRIAAHSGTVLRMTKRLLREGQRSSLESLLALSARCQAVAHKTPEHQQAVQAFVARRR